MILETSVRRVNYGFRRITLGALLFLVWMPPPANGVDALDVGGANIRIVPPARCVRVDGLDREYDAYQAKSRLPTTVGLAEFWKPQQAEDLLQGNWFNKTVWYQICTTKSVIATPVSEKDMPAVLAAVRAGLPAILKNASSELDAIEQRGAKVAHERTGKVVNLQITEYAFLGILEQSRSTTTVATYMTARASGPEVSAQKMSFINVNMTGRIGPRLVMLEGTSRNTSVKELIALKGVLRAWYAELRRLNPDK